MKVRRSWELTGACLLLLLFPSTAHAYIDPGYGALIWQAAVAAILGSIFFFRHTIGGFIRRLRGGSKPAPEEPEASSSTDADGPPSA